VKKIQFTPPRNPNKWGKTLAPWFNDNCRETKKKMTEAKKLYNKGDERITQASKEYLRACQRGRQEFAKQTPDMLKY
jgi:hypothetical protein